MSQKTAEDIEFEKKLAKATYKTTYQGIGTEQSKSIKFENCSLGGEEPWNQWEVH